MKKGDSIGDFVLEHPFRVGGSGYSVWKGIHASTRETAVLKMNESKQSDEPPAALEREQALLARVSHPNIAAFKDFFFDPKARQWVLVQEFAGEQTLRSAFQGGLLSLDDIILVGLHLTDAAIAVQRRGMVFLDFKPENAARNPGADWKIFDFGAAMIVGRDQDLPVDEQRTIPSALLRRPSTVGTPSYMSPERFKGQAGDIASDIYSIGIILCEAVLGLNPFDRTSLEATREAVQSFSPSLPAVTGDPIRQRLYELIERSIAKDPRIRPPPEILCRELHALLVAQNRSEGWSRRL